jgi:hypothetical protein
MTVEADVNEICRHSVPHRPVRRVGHADCHRVTLEAFSYFIVEPGFMAKLDGVSRAFPVPQIL